MCLVPQRKQRYRYSHPPLLARHNDVHHNTGCHHTQYRKGPIVQRLRQATFPARTARTSRQSAGPCSDWLWGVCEQPARGDISDTPHRLW